jgi:hypothetical protein
MKMWIRGCLLVAPMFLAGKEALGQSYSAAGTACRTWTDLRASGRATPEMNWLQGYMVAAFEHQPLLAKHKAEFSNDKLYTWIDDYCSHAPAQSLIVAVHSLESYLVKAYSPSSPQ